MTEQNQRLLHEVAFHFGINEAHAARTTMLNDLRVLLASNLPQATRTEYVWDVVGSDVLDKSTHKQRKAAGQTKGLPHV